jgi:flagellar motility protein MotE (MotC chaperone)
MNFTNLKILPLLIFVAMVSFSVRFVEVALDVTSLSGGAMAAGAKKKEEDKKEESHGGDEKKATSNVKTVEDAPPPLEGPMDKDKSGALDFEQAKDANGKPLDWQDSTALSLSDTEASKDLADDLAKRRADMDRRERELQSKEALLRAGQQELQRKFDELTALRSEIEKLLKTQSDQESTRITSLVKIYEGMKPADAARIFNTLDLDILVSVMSKMSERKLSPVLAAMDPERAKTVTIMLAEEKKLPELPSAP